MKFCNGGNWKKRPAAEWVDEPVFRRRGLGLGIGGLGLPVEACSTGTLVNSAGRGRLFGLGVIRIGVSAAS